MKYFVPALLAFLIACAPAPPPAAKEAAAAPTYFQVDPTTAGTLAGRVTLKGRAPAREPIRIDEDLTCVQLNPKGMLTETVLTGAGGAVANAFVYVKRGLEGKQFAPAAAEQTVVIDQKNCRFAPRMLGVRVGQTLRVTNSDPLTHNIHPMPKMNREWNQSQEEGAPPLVRKFVRPEMMMRVKCNVHSWMRTYINVMEHPYFAVTDAAGAFEIKNLPPGDYTLEVLHEKLAPQELAVHVDTAGRHTISFTLQGE